ncbi:hypothetical protein Gohar_009297 [Gossypium harknessii]|uniref:Uncharacterized protein n=1 Tax=Gossypium harknessii TaxID=34285 RepID=A0A7J9GMD8_9ROSI|nr:hypothetical protein [Gossypium harknessii]
MDIPKYEMVCQQPESGSILSPLSDSFMQKSGHSNGVHEAIPKHNCRHTIKLWEKKINSHPNLDWMIHWMQESSAILQEFAQKNIIRVPNYTSDMFGSTHLEQEEEEHEVKKKVNMRKARRMRGWTLRRRIEPLMFIIFSVGTSHEEAQQLQTFND